MAVMYCWKTGLIGICAACDQPESTIVIATGMNGKLRTEMISTARHEPKQNIWFVPRVEETEDEDEKFRIVENYADLLARRHLKRKGRRAFVKDME